MDRGSQLSKDDKDDKEDEEEEEEQEEEEQEEQEEEATDIKSNNPHLAGGEKNYFAMKTNGIGWCSSKY